jgi:hypothetical protein
MYGSSWRAALGVLVALACLPLPAQEVYKSVDAQGHVVYSDRGSTKTAPKTALHVEEPDPAEAARLAKQQQILDAQEQQRAKEQVASDHAKNARNNYFRLQETNRLYKRDADGNRVYYSDAEADTLRQQAKQAMTSACG